jgi:RecA/RadA recombinase
MQNIVIGIFGYKGSGKTLMMIILLYIEHLAGKKVYVNMKNLNFPTEIIKPKDLIKLSKALQGCTIGIDELHTLADSRKSGKSQNINISNFFLQSRHRGVNVIYTDQYQGQDDKRIRENTDIKIVARNLYIDSDGDGIPDKFEYTIIDVRTEEIKTVVIYGKPIFELYDDSEIIDIYEHQKKK